MATDRCKIDQMAHVIMEGLQEYADLATEDMKAAVKKAGNKAKSDVQAGAPAGAICGKALVLPPPRLACPNSSRCAS